MSNTIVSVISKTPAAEDIPFLTGDAGIETDAKILHDHLLRVAPGLINPNWRKPEMGSDYRCVTTQECEAAQLAQWQIHDLAGNAEAKRQVARLLLASYGSVLLQKAAQLCSRHHSLRPPSGDDEIGTHSGEALSICSEAFFEAIAALARNPKPHLRLWQYFARHSLPAAICCYYHVLLPVKLPRGAGKVLRLLGSTPLPLTEEAVRAMSVNANVSVETLRLIHMWYCRIAELDAGTAEDADETVDLVDPSKDLEEIENHLVLQEWAGRLATALRSMRERQALGARRYLVALLVYQATHGDDSQDSPKGKEEGWERVRRILGDAFELDREYRRAHFQGGRSGVWSLLPVPGNDEAMRELWPAGNEYIRSHAAFKQWRHRQRGLLERFLDEPPSG